MSATLAATISVSLRRMRAAWPIVLAAGLHVPPCLEPAGRRADVRERGLHRGPAPGPRRRPRGGRQHPGIVARPARTRRPTPTSSSPSDSTVRSRASAAPSSAPLAPNSFALPGAAEGAVPESRPAGLHGGPRGPRQPGRRPRGRTDAAGAGSRPSAGRPGPLGPSRVARQVAEPLGLKVGDVARRSTAACTSGAAPGPHRRHLRHRRPWRPGLVGRGAGARRHRHEHGLRDTRPLLHDPGRPVRAGDADPDRADLAGLPDGAALTVDGIDRLRTRVEGLDRHIEAALDGVPVTVPDGASGILATAQRSLLVSRTGVLLLVIQLVVLAAYAVLLSAALLVEHRRVDTAMLRSRGAGPIRIAAPGAGRGARARRSRRRSSGRGSRSPACSCSTSSVRSPTSVCTWTHRSRPTRTSPPRRRPSSASSPCSCRPSRPGVPSPRSRAASRGPGPVPPASAWGSTSRFSRSRPSGSGSSACTARR